MMLDSRIIGVVLSQNSRTQARGFWPARPGCADAPF